jgi:ABC-type phosphate transport system permease subunit
VHGNTICRKTRSDQDAKDSTTPLQESLARVVDTALRAGVYRIGATSMEVCFAHRETAYDPWIVKAVDVDAIRAVAEAMRERKDCS